MYKLLLCCGINFITLLTMTHEEYMRNFEPCTFWLHWFHDFALEKRVIMWKVTLHGSD